MYRILHWLFGWDYVAWHNIAADGVARVWKSPDGRVVYWRYRATRVLDVITEPKQVTWLTCPPDKYFKSKEEDKQ